MRIFLYLCGMLLAAAPATATVLDWHFSGTVWEDVVPSLYPLAPGSPFSGTLHIDTGAASHPGDASKLPFGYSPDAFTVSETDPGSAGITIDLGGLHLIESAHLLMYDAVDGAGVTDELRIVPDAPDSSSPNLPFVSIRYLDFFSQTIQDGAITNRLPIGDSGVADILVRGVIFLPPPERGVWIYDFSGRIDALTPAPEPTSWATMLLGFGAVGSALRRRRSVKSPGVMPHRGQ
jgi:hypothetical protein